MEVAEALQSSEARYRILTEGMKDVVWTLDPVTLLFQYVSPSAEALLGYTPDEIRAKSLDDSVPPKDKDGVRALAAERVAAFEASGGSEPLHFTDEVLQTRKDGTPVWTEVATRFYRDADSGCVMIAGLTRDVTKRKAAESARAESDELFHAAFDQAAVGMAQVDLEGRFLRANKCLCKMLGYTPEGMLGLTFAEISHPDEAGRDVERSRNMLAGESDTYRVEKRYIRKDSSTVWANLTVALARGEGGEPKCFVDVIEDITGSRTSEQALQESERLVQSILNTTPNLIYIYDIVENRNVYANREVTAFLGYSPEQIEAFGSELFANILHPDDGVHVAEHHARLAAASDGEVLSVDYRMQRASGEWRWLHSRDVPFAHAPDGSVTQILGFTVDVTPQHQADVDLRESNARLEKMVHDVTEVIGKVVEARDPYTLGHERRVAALGKAIALEMGLPGSDIDTVEMAALVHDVGKLTIPTEILTKPGLLSETEFALIREHSSHGYEILKRIDFGCPVADIVLQHHERMDGSGYPLGLSGDGISMAARVLAVADVVEAMSSHRPYRPALGIEAALRELRRNQQKFDPTVVAACVRLHESGRLDFGPEAELG